MDIIRIVISPWEQRSQGRREGKSSTVIALARNHESFGAIKSFRKDRREGKAVRLTYQRRRVGILGINEVALSNKAGGCTQTARATHWEQVGLKWCRDLLLTVIAVDHCKGQGSGTSGFMGGFVAGSRMFVCMHLSMWEATLYLPAQTEEKRWVLCDCSRNSNSGYRILEESCWPIVGQHAKTLVYSAQCATGSYPHWKDHSTALSFLLFLTILTRDQAPAGRQLLSYHWTSMCGPAGPEFRAISVVVTSLSIACSDTSAGWGVLLLECRNLLPKPGLLILW